MKHLIVRTYEDLEGAIRQAETLEDLQQISADEDAEFMLRLACLPADPDLEALWVDEARARMVCPDCLCPRCRAYLLGCLHWNRLTYHAASLPYGENAHAYRTV